MCKPSTQKAEAGGRGRKISNSRSALAVETSLSYVRPHLKKKKKISVVAKYSIPKIPALGSPRQEDEEFKASLVYRDLTEKQSKAKA